MFTACFKNMEPQKFVGKAVIVTGSSSGIGQGIALLLAQQGASVTIHGRSMEGLKETLKQINDCGVNADKIHMVRGNITDPSVQDKLVDETVQKFGRLDVVVNNAGMMSKPGAKDAFDNFDFLVNVLVKSIIRINELALPHLEKTKGNIVNMSSIGALKVFSGNEHYCMLKASLDHYMRFQAQALASKGIRMNNLNPGIVATQLFTVTGLSKTDAAKASTDWAVSASPMGRSGTPREMANCVSFLASSEASYVTGITLVCDGGLLLGKAN